MWRSRMSSNGKRGYRRSAQGVGPADTGRSEHSPQNYSPVTRWGLSPIYRRYLESDQNLIFIFVLQIDVRPWQRKCFKATPGLLSLPRSSILVLKGFEVRYRLAFLLLALAVPAAAQDRGADMRTAFARVQHLKHCINAWSGSPNMPVTTLRHSPAAIPMRRISRSWPSSDSTMSDSVSTRCRWSSR